jgi:ATP-dependent DNA helicase RecQ
MPGPAERLAWLADHIPALPGSGIVYTLTTRDADRVAEWLRGNGVDAHAYHSGKSDEERQALEQALLTNDIKCLVATTALGMGYDKPDLTFVVHYQTPGNVVAYYQQVGAPGGPFLMPMEFSCLARRKMTSMSTSETRRSHLNGRSIES